MSLKQKFKKAVVTGTAAVTLAVGPAAVALADCNANVQDKNGRTALHRVLDEMPVTNYPWLSEMPNPLISRTEDKIDRLYGKGVDISIRDKTGQTAPELAASRGMPEISTIMSKIWADKQIEKPYSEVSCVKKPVSVPGFQ